MVHNINVWVFFIYRVRSLRWYVIKDICFPGDVMVFCTAGTLPKIWMQQDFSRYMSGVSYHLPLIAYHIVYEHSEGIG